METTTPVAPAAIGPTSSTPRAASSRATSSPVASSPRFAMQRACAPRDTAQTATFAACPPAPARVSARTSPPGASGSSSRTITSSITSPRVAIRTSYNRSMDEEDRAARLRSFLIGGVVGASAAVATARRRRDLARRRRERKLHPAGLAAFEEAPCFQELLDEEDQQLDT